LPQITKREGIQEEFKPEKIAGAVAKAMLETEEGINEQDLSAIVQMVTGKATSLDEITVEATQDIVEDVLVKTGKTEVANDTFCTVKNVERHVKQDGYSLNCKVPFGQRSTSTIMKPSTDSSNVYQEETDVLPDDSVKKNFHLEGVSYQIEVSTNTDSK
jgi:anaerobic ribonucleoside-triphosphate reductase